MRTRRIGAAVLGVLLFTACSTKSVDIRAVQEYAKTTAAASTSFQAVANDYYRSCLRQREYAQPVTVGGEPLSSEMPVRPPPPSSPSPGTIPVPVAGGGNDADCHVSSALAYRWQLENQVLLDYVQSLGYVAGIDTKPKHLGALAASLHSAGILQNDNVATAAGNLATGLASEIIAARQRRSLYLIVQSARNAGIDAFAADLEHAAGIYQGELQRESNAVTVYYTMILSGEEHAFALAECSTNPSSQVRKALFCVHIPSRKHGGVRTVLRDEGRAAVLRERIRNARLARSKAYSLVGIHNNAAIAYSRAIGVIAAGNDALIKAPPNDLAGEAQAVQPFVSDLQSDVNALIGALKK